MKTFAIRAFLVVADENADDVSAMNANNKAQHPTLGVLISRALFVAITAKCTIKKEEKVRCDFSISRRR